VAAIDTIIRILTPTIEGMGFEVVRIQLISGRRQVLQIMAERPEFGGLTITDCEALSQAISAKLDVEDPLPGKFMLEVSSPGIDRPLTRMKDFEAFAGHEARMELATPIEGRKKFSGILAGLRATR